MPRDLFGDLHGSRFRTTARGRYTVPLSLAAHVAVLTAIVAASLLGPAVLPAPASGEIILLAAPHIPEPPPVRLAERREPPPVPAASPTAAPLVAPDAIRPELPEDYSLPDVTSTSGIIAGLSSFDTVVGDPPSPAPPEPMKPVPVGGQVRAPVKIHDVAPVYPQLAVAARQQGTVIVEATLDRDGRVSAARVLRSIPLLDDAALAAVRQWVYEPTLLNGVPVPVLMTVTVTFQLK